MSRLQNPTMIQQIEAIWRMAAMDVALLSPTRSVAKVRSAVARCFQFHLIAEPLMGACTALWRAASIKGMLFRQAV